MTDSARLNAGTGDDAVSSVYRPSANLKAGSAPLDYALLRTELRSLGRGVLGCMVVIDGKEVLDLERRSFHLHLAYLTAYASDLASFPYLGAVLVVIAGDDILRAVGDHPYDAVGAYLRALAAADALLLVDDDIPFLRLGDGSYRADVYA